MKKIRVSAPGKLHLLGEHSVVYGKKALLSAVNKRCFVTLKPRFDGKIEFTAPDYSATFLLEEKQIVIKTILAKARWDKFASENNRELLKKISPTLLDFAAIAVGESILHFRKKLPSGFSLHVTSEIPLGVGMGSSAALAVAIAGAMSVFLTGKLQRDDINTIAFETEKKQHGFPSGGDNTASTYGGFLSYTKSNTTSKIQKLSLKLSEKLQHMFCIINTGTPKETTGEMVSMVRELYKKNPKKFENIFTIQEKLVDQLIKALEKENIEEIFSILKSGERNLEKINVVSNFSEKIIKEIETVGSCAKICGGGGITKSTGMLLVFSENQKKVQSIAQNHNLSYDQILLGEEGVRSEK